MLLGISHETPIGLKVLCSALLTREGDLFYPETEEKACIHPKRNSP